MIKENKNKDHKQNKSKADAAIDPTTEGFINTNIDPQTNNRSANISKMDAPKQGGPNTSILIIDGKDNPNQEFHKPEPKIEVISKGERSLPSRNKSVEIDEQARTMKPSDKMQSQDKAQTSKNAVKDDKKPLEDEIKTRNTAIGPSKLHEISASPGLNVCHSKRRN